jgi:hypothetical protein
MALSDREYDSGGFITTTLADEIASPTRDPRDTSITLGLDEGMNNEEQIGALCPGF